MNEQPEARNLDFDPVSRTCGIKNRSGRYYLVRLGTRHARVANLEPPRGSGFLVKRSVLEDIRGTAPAQNLGASLPPTLPQPAGTWSWFPQVADLNLPYGLPDLDPEVVMDQGGRVRCFVRGCTRMLRTPSRTDPGEVCPDHGIRSHRSGTFSYPPQEAHRNVIVSKELICRLHTHPFKYESRMNLEKSEDAVTASVFVSLKEAGCLKDVARWITGQNVTEEPRLFLWGIEINNALEPWDLLIGARNRFERRLPVKRPSTEPDIALYLPGSYLVLIEAKLTSPNPYYLEGPRKDGCSLTKNELLDTYNDLTLKILDVGKARQQKRVHYQLWRNLVFAEWMALMDGHGTVSYHANLTRWGFEHEACDEFRRLIRPEFQDRFQHLTWEDIYSVTGFQRENLSRLRIYLENKTVGLRQAFHLGRVWRQAG